MKNLKKRNPPAFLCSSFVHVILWEDLTRKIHEMTKNFNKLYTSEGFHLASFLEV